MAFTRNWNVADPADNELAANGAKEIREFKADVEERLEKWFGGSIANSIDTDAAVALLASNRALWFYENTAPTGWTLVANQGDELLAVKGGSTYTAGGTNAGNWVIPANAMPEHTHEFPYHYPSGTPAIYSTLAAGANGALMITIANAGQSANTYRPSARVGIICTKD